MRDGFGH